MKRFINASIDTKGNIWGYAAEQVKEVLQDISNFGYTVTVSSNGASIVISIVNKKDAEHMPTIKIEPVQVESELYLDPTLIFPTLKWNEDDYVDSIESNLKTWARLGKCITEISNFAFNFNKWKYDEAEDEWYY